MQSYDTIDHKGFTVYIVYDEYADNPRDMMDALGSFTFDAEERDYPDIATKGDDTVNITGYYYGGWYNWMKNNVDTIAVVLPVRFSSGSYWIVSTGEINTIPENGYHQAVYTITRKNLQKEYGATSWRECGAETRSSIQGVLEGELKEVESWLNGDVYGYRIVDQNENEVDSCYGFYGADYCKKEALEQADYYANERDEKHALACLAGI